MNRLALPERLRPKSDPDDTQVSVQVVARRVYSADEIAKHLSAFGLVSVNAEKLQALPELGDVADSLGLMKTIRGATLVSQGAVTTAIAEMEKILANPKTKRDDRIVAAKAIGYLVEKSSKVNKDSVKSDVSVLQASVQAEQVRRQSFKPGEKLVSPLQK